MKRAKLFLFLLVSLCLVLVVIQNTDIVQMRFLWFSREVPALLLLFLTASGGFILGVLTALLTRGRR